MLIKALYKISQRTFDLITLGLKDNYFVQHYFP